MDGDAKTIMDAMISLSNSISTINSTVEGLKDPVMSLTDALLDRVYLLYDIIVSCLPRDPASAVHGFWVNGNDEIMCKTKAEAETIADFFEAIGFDIMHTYYYEDMSPADNCFGWWAAYIDG